jgi:predicted MPP superfamily phosphohydrolase
LKAWPSLGIFVLQVILLLAHAFLYFTWTWFWPGLPAGVAGGLGIALLILSVSFVADALLSFRHSNPVLRVFYGAAVIWLGFLNFLFYAAVLSWPLWGILHLAGVQPPFGALRTWVGVGLSGLAVLAGLYGIVNARWIRIRRHKVRLDHLPESWKGRKAMVMTDLHLGNINGVRFSKRMVRIAERLRPDIIFLPGDLFDGVKADLDHLLEPFTALKPPLGIYFCTGNHEEFGDPTHYIEPIARAGIRVLKNERVTIDGMHIAGVSYRDTTHPARLRALLEGMHLNSGHPSILLHHVPSRLPIAEKAGVSLQLSGHTHCGQIFPYNLFTYRIFGKFTYGLQRFGDLQVYTSSGAGTWGPPMRVGTQPEVVALEFE